MEKCSYHDKLSDDVSGIGKLLVLLQKDIEYLRRDQEVILARFGKHVEDAERDGGRHERLHNAETDICALKRELANDRIMGRWFMIGCGIIGGLIGSGASEAVVKFLGIWR